MAKNESNEEVQMVTVSEGFLKGLECPVCLNYMASPISLCGNGHNTCGECRPRLQKCPICNCHFVGARNLALEAVINGIKCTCKNANNGCSEMFSANRIKNHEEFCLKGPIKCPMNKFPYLKCDWIGDIKEFKTHSLLNLTHEAIYDNPFLSRTNDTVGRLVFLFDEIFLYYKLKKADNWYFIVMLVGSAAQASKYESIFTLSERNGTNKIIFTTDIKNYEEDFNSIINNHYCCQINDRVVQKFIYESEYDYEIQMMVKIASKE